MAEMITENVIRKINETLSDHLAAGDVKKFVGRRPTKAKTRISRIDKKVHEYRIDSRVYKDDHWQCVDDYCAVIRSLGGEPKIWSEGSGHTDTNENGLPLSIVWNVEISYDDGMVISGYIKAMAAGSQDHPFDQYETCIILWPKEQKRVI